jgi:hypothetical protein
VPPPTSRPTEVAPVRPAASTSAAKLPPFTKESSFVLTTTPAGATAVFDNNSAQPCITPCNLSLPSGRHTLVLSHPGYRDEPKIIEVPRDPGLIVDLAPLAGTFSLITNPPGLKVIIDGKEHAQKTPLSVTLPAGTHQIEVINGADKREFPVEIRDNQIKSQTVNWSQ